MKIIAGLGNPGRKYEQTRHNVGWWVLDHLADVWRFDPWRRDGDALASDGRIGATRVRLIKPQTYMNLSGAALRPYLRRETWSAASDLLVIVDDVALPVGMFRIRAKGSAGGHNGLRSIEAAIGNQEYARLRVGIKPAQSERSVGVLSDFVLDRFGREEREAITGLFAVIDNAVKTWVLEGALMAMNRYNRREQTGASPDDDSPEEAPEKKAKKKGDREPE